MTEGIPSYCRICDYAVETKPLLSTEYHVLVNADVQGIDIIFVDEREDELNPLGVKGLGEIGVVGTAAAIASAVYHATGKRVRDLPITLDKLLVSLPLSAPPALHP